MITAPTVQCSDCLVVENMRGVPFNRQTIQAEGEKAFWLFGIPKGWIEVHDDLNSDVKHFCPKCSHK